MYRAQELTHHFSHDNLHIALSEQFEQPEADALIEMLRGKETQCKRIFIDVQKVVQPHPSAVSAFKTSLSALRIGPERVFFKGKLVLTSPSTATESLSSKRRPTSGTRERNMSAPGTVPTAHAVTISTNSDTQSTEGASK